jgi:hypothetical protein
VRSICCAANDSGNKVETAYSANVTGGFFFSISDFMIIFSFQLPFALSVFGFDRTVTLRLPQ